MFADGLSLAKSAKLKTVQTFPNLQYYEKQKLPIASCLELVDNSSDNDIIFVSVRIILSYKYLSKPTTGLHTDINTIEL